MLDNNETVGRSPEDLRVRESAPASETYSQSPPAEEILSASEKRLRTQNDVLVKLTRECSLKSRDLGSGLRKITEAAAQILDVERAGVWLYNDDHSKILCADLYERIAGRHSEGAELTAAAYPAYFTALESARTIAAHDARIDPQTKEFSTSYLIPLGITSMLDAPIRLDGRTVGVICHEHIGPARQWAPDEQNLAGTLGDIVSRVLEEHKRKRAEEELEESFSLLRATLESTADAILVVDRERKIVTFNQKFLEMWRLPESIIASRDANRGLEFATEQIKDPEGFLTRVKDLHDQTEAESFDVLEFKDGRVFERYSQPQRIGGKSVGRVWSFRDITDRRRAEEALRESSQFNHQVIANAREGIIVYDRDLRYLVWNSFMEELSGLRAEKILGKCPRDLPTLLLEEHGKHLINKKTVEQMEASLRRAMTGETFSYLDVPFVIKQTGMTGWSSVRYGPFRNAQGEIVGAIATIRDVTEQKRAEEEMRRSERRYRTLVEASPDVIMNIDRQGTILFINHTLSQFTVEGVIGTNVTDYIPAEQAVEYRKKIEKLFETGEPQSIVLDSVGPTRWQSQLIPIIQEGKIETALIIASDITERDRAAMELEKSVSLLRATLESTADGILVVDRDGKMVSFNQKFVEIWRLPDSIIASRDAKKARAVSMHELKDPEGFIKRLDELYSHPDATGYDILEFKDGRIVERYSQPQRIGGTSVGRVWSFRDITERVRAEGALRKAFDGMEIRVEQRTAELSKANAILQQQISERKRAEKALQDALKKLQQLSHHVLQIQENEYQFISRELHDNIAQSINAVKMGLERLDRDGTSGLSESRLEIRAAVTQLKKISQEVRKLSKQKRPEILDELGLTATLESYIKDFQKLTGIQMKFINKTSDKLLPSNVATHLYRIVQETLNNIAQHARATHAVIRLEETGKELRLSIKDNGIGFSLDQSVKDGKGLHGIGLISIQERANLLKGTLDILSSPGNGTEISVKVPGAE
jgi:PAS domain S-box-containing protein